MNTPLDQDTKVWVLTFVGQTHYYEYFLTRQAAVNRAQRSSGGRLQFRKTPRTKECGTLYERPPGFDHDMDRCNLYTTKLGNLLNFEGWS